MYAVSMEPEKVKLNRPVYAGFTVLEDAKLIMYKFHYDYTVPQFGHRAKLLLTDTDSLVYHIESPNVYDEINQRADLFDFSDYPASHPLHSKVNMKVMGKFKDEFNGKVHFKQQMVQTFHLGAVLSEVVALKAKMYSVLSGSGEEKHTAKGVSKAIVKHVYRHAHYYATLMNDTRLSAVMTRFQSFDHQLFTVQQKKLTLSSFDNKRFILDDGCDTLAYGHCRIRDEGLHDSEFFEKMKRVN